MSGFAVGIDCGENGVELARIVLVHRHRHMQPGLAPPDAAHHFETPHVRAHQKCTSSRVQLRAHERLALDRNVEAVVLFVDEIDAIVDAAGEVQDMPEAVASAGTAAQARAADSGGNAAARRARTGKNTAAIAVKSAAAQRAAQSQRADTSSTAAAEHFRVRGCRSIRRRFARPLGSTALDGRASTQRHGIRPHVHRRTALMDSVPARAVRSATRTVKRIEPFAGDGVLHDERLAGTDTSREIWRWRPAIGSDRERA